MPKTSFQIPSTNYSSFSPFSAPPFPLIIVETIYIKRQTQPNFLVRYKKKIMLQTK